MENEVWRVSVIAAPSPSAAGGRSRGPRPCLKGTASVSARDALLTIQRLQGDAGAVVKTCCLHNGDRWRAGSSIKWPQGFPLVLLSTRQQTQRSSLLRGFDGKDRSQGIWRCLSNRKDVSGYFTAGLWTLTCEQQFGTMTSCSGFQSSSLLLSNFAAPWHSSPAFLSAGKREGDGTTALPWDRPWGVRTL